MQQHLRWAFAGRGAFQHLFDDLVLCVSELVTTAVEAGSNTVSLTLDNTARAVRLAITDHAADSLIATQIRRSGNGHRARIIEAVASRWGVSSSQDAHEVWVEFDLTDTASGAVACH